MRAFLFVSLLISLLFGLSSASASLEIPPPPLPLISVPLRWCVIGRDTNGDGRFTPGQTPTEIGPAAFTDPASVDGVDTDDVMWKRHERASDRIWVPWAQITFRSAFTEEVRERSHFPIIPDPAFGGGAKGMYGDLVVETFGQSPEQEAAVTNCRAAWKNLEDEFGLPLPGLIAINARRLIGSSGAFKVQGLQYGGPACTQVCRDAQSITANSDGYIIVQDRAFGPQPDEATLAHELGHALWLQHGDGLDNDGDGEFDECCDSEPDTGGSLMSESGGESVVRPLQKERARLAAAKTPGATIAMGIVLEPLEVVADEEVDDYGDVSDPSNDIGWARVALNEGRGEVELSQRLLGVLPAVPDHLFSFILDADANEGTGGSAASIGLATALPGAELAARVTWEVGGQSTDVWRFEAGIWREVSDPRVRSEVFTAQEAETGFPAMSRVSLVLPIDLLSGFTGSVRAQVVAEGPGTATAARPRDQLPSGLLTAGALYEPRAPNYPACAVAPPRVESGTFASVHARALIPARPLKVILGDERVAEDLADGNGEADVTFLIPIDSSEGLRLVTVGTAGTALTADCAVEVFHRFDVRIGKTDGLEHAAPGQTVTYTLRVIETRGRAVAGLRITDATPPALQDVQWCEGAECVPSQPTPVDATLDLEAGGELVVRIRGTVSPGATGVLENRAEVALTADRADANPADNVSLDTTAISIAPGLSGICEGFEGDFAEGGSVAVRFLIVNGGPAAQGDNAGPEFTFVLPPGLTLISASADSGVVSAAGGSVEWNGDLAVAQSTAVSVVARIKSSTAGTTICGQGMIFFDADGNGSNESQRLTDDPMLPGGADPCCFIVGTMAIPTLAQWVQILLALLLAACAVGRLAALGRN